MSQHWLKPNWDPGLTLPHLPIQHLLDQGMQALVLDVDRTLLPGYEIELPVPVKAWIKEAQHHLLLHLFSKICKTSEDCNGNEVVIVAEVMMSSKSHTTCKSHGKQ